MTLPFRLLILLGVLSGCTFSPTVTTAPLESGTTSLLQTISIVDETTVWVSGHAATFCRSTDGGATWQVFSHPTIDSLQFRDIHAFNQDQIVLMSAGSGSLSRIFLFNAAQNTLREAYQMPHPQGFLNTLEFWNDSVGLAFGDSFFGQHFLLKTTNSGQSWDRIDPTLLPNAGEGEGGFAASGTCISLLPDGRAWIGTGAGGHSNILFSEDFGATWSSSGSPLIKGLSAGITSIRVQENGFGIVVGGDLAQPDAFTENAAFTEDFGATWQQRGLPVTMGAFYGSGIAKHSSGAVLFICGPKGIDYSMDEGETWQNLTIENYWAVSFHPSGMGYAVGKDGNILKIKIE